LEWLNRTQQLEDDRGVPAGNPYLDTSRLLHFRDTRLSDVGEAFNLRTDHPFPLERSLLHVSIRDSMDPMAILRLEGLG
jgi:hypothetical protein